MKAPIFIFFFFSIILCYTFTQSIGDIHDVCDTVELYTYSIIQYQLKRMCSTMKELLICKAFN